MDRPAEPLTMYGSSTDLPALDWRWVDEQLRISGSYWITANQSNGAPQSRPVWGVWRHDQLQLSIGSRRITEQIPAGTPAAVNLGSDTDVIIVEAVAGEPTADDDAVAEYNDKYDWEYRVDEYGPLTTLRPTKVMAWRSSGWAGRGGFQEAGRWTFEAMSEPDRSDRAHAIGGVFFRSADPEATRAWYSEHLGLEVDPHGSTFTWRRDGAPGVRAHTQWAPFGDDTDYFGDRQQQFMVNYRVDDLDRLINRLRSGGVQIVGPTHVEPFGRFQHIIDGDGRRVELWEPNDVVYEQVLDGVTRS